MVTGGVLLVRPLWRAAAMVAGDEGNHVDFVRFEARRSLFLISSRNVDGGAHS